MTKLILFIHNFVKKKPPAICSHYLLKTAWQIAPWGMKGLENTDIDWWIIDIDKSHAFQSF